MGRLFDAHQLAGILLAERGLQLPGAQQSFGYGAQLLDVITVVDRALMHRDRELTAEGELVQGLQQNVTTR